MTTAAATPAIVVLGEGELADAVAGELAGADAGLGRVHVATTVAELRAAGMPDEPVGVVLVVDDETDHGDLDDVLAQVVDAATPSARVLLVTARRSLDLSWSVDEGHVDGLVAAPWTPGNLATYTHFQLARWRRRRTRAAADAPPPADVGSGFLRQLELPTRKVAEELLASVEAVLGPRPRVRLPQGVRLGSTADQPGDQLVLVLDGRVSLTVAARSRAITLHHASTGPLIGLLGLTSHHGSTITARTTTPCEVVTLTIEQLDRALLGDARVGTALTVLSVQALSARLRRSNELQIEKTDLAEELASTIQQLERAREDLVQQARLATLGQLTAGFAHELNNPAAALASSLDHLAEGLPELLGALPDSEQARTALVDATTRPATAAREERASRRALAGVVRDPALVRRLVAAGITDPDDARTLLDGPTARLRQVEAAAGVGTALRALRLACSHIGTLVQALRHHARPVGPDTDPIPTDVGDSVHSALALLEHRLKRLRTTVEVDTDLPTVLARPGTLVQVWTNLLANAADALADRDGGHVRVRARAVADAELGDVVRVEVRDDGPGVPSELHEDIFQPRFTTKQGVVRYGLGLGLSIASTIVTAQQGRIEVDSVPGRTVFTVDLPVRVADEEGEA